MKEPRTSGKKRHIIIEDERMAKEKKRHRNEETDDTAKSRTKKRRTSEESDTTTVLGTPSQSKQSTLCIDKKPKSIPSSIVRKSVKQTSISSFFR